MKSWNKIRLGDACQTNFDTYSLKDDWSFVNYLDTSNIVDNKIDEIQFIDVTKEELPSRARRKVKHNSIIYSTVRPDQRHFGIIKSQPDNFLVSTGFAVIDVDPTILDADFLYYKLSQNSIVETLHSIAAQSTSAYPAIKPSDLENLELEIPNIETQAKIGKFLRNLDDKIRHNTAINDNLVQQVSDIFNYWFTQFDFPNTSGKPYKSSGGKMIWNSIIKREIPESWSVATYDTICSYENGDRSENYPSSDDFVERGIPFINGGAINGNSIDTSSLQYISKEKYNSLRAGKVSKKDILLTLRGSLDKCIYSPFEISAIASALVILRAKQKIFSSYLYYSLKSQYFKQLCSNYNNGSVQTNLSVDVIKRFPCIIPSSDILQKFDNYASQIDNKLLNIFEENEQLLSLRNWLLPILMNGQATISD